MLSEGRGDGSELAEACCAVVRTRGTRLLLELGHAQIALRLVVGEGYFEVREKEQDPVLALSETLEARPLFAELGASTLPWRPLRNWRQLDIGLGKNRPVANGETVAC